MSISTLSRRSAIGGLLAGPALAVGQRRAWAQAGPIRVGLLQSISGPLAAVGVPHVQGATIAVSQLNEAGGIDGRHVELIVRDTRANANDAVAAMRELAGMGVNLVMGEALTGPNLALWPIAAPLNQVYVAVSAVAMEFNHDLYNRNCFRAGQNVYMEFLGEAKTIADHSPNLKRWGALLADGQGFRDAQSYLYYGLKKFYAEKGTQIELMEPVVAKIGTPDYRDQAGKLAAQQLDGMVLADSGSEVYTFLQQARPFGLFQNLGAIADMALSTKVGQTLKRDTPKNLWTGCTWIYDAYKQYPMAQAFNKAAMAETKTTLIDPFLAQAHLGITTLATGVRNAKTTKTEDVISAIETMTYDTVYGPLQFRAEDHQLKFDAGYIRVGPDDGEAGWKIYDFVHISWKETIEPPSPGKKFELRG